MKKSKLLFSVFLIIWVPGVWGISFQTYRLSDEFGYCWDGLGRDWNGNIYVACGNGEKTEKGNAALFRFSFSKNRFEKMMDIKTVSEKFNNWQDDDIPGKVHSSIQQGIDGRLYFSTHSALEGEYEPDVVAYKKYFRGGHVYAFDPISGKGSDISTPNAANHEGLFEVAVGLSFAHNKKYIYAGGGYPFGNVYRIDMANGNHEVIANTNQQKGHITRKIFSDIAGRLYFPNQQGRLVIYDPDKDRLDRLGIDLMEMTYISAVTYSQSGDNIYFVASPSDLRDEKTAIFRYSVSGKQLIKLCVFDPTEGDHRDWRANLHLRWDLKRLFFINYGKLFSFDLESGEKSTLAVNLPVGKLYGSNGVDRYGNIWFTEAGSNKVYRFHIPEPCGIECSSKHARFKDPRKTSK